MGRILSGGRDVVVYGARAEDLLEDGVQASVIVQTSAGDVWCIAGLPEEHSGAILLLGATTGEITSGLTDVWVPEGREQEDWCPPDLLHMDPAEIIALVRTPALKAWRDARRAAGLWM